MLLILHFTVLEDLLVHVHKRLESIVDEAMNCPVTGVDGEREGGREGERDAQRQSRQNDHETPTSTHTLTHTPSSLPHIHTH